MNKPFWTTLLFAVQGDKWAAEFTDRKEAQYQIVTDRKKVPGLRYRCKLLREPFGYSLQAAFIESDKLDVVIVEGTVCVHLNGLPIGNTIYVPLVSTIDDCLLELNSYFRNKELQLASTQEIKQFVNKYELACKEVDRDVVSSNRKSDHKLKTVSKVTN